MFSISIVILLPIWNFKLCVIRVDLSNHHHNTGMLSRYEFCGYVAIHLLFSATSCHFKVIWYWNVKKIILHWLRVLMKNETGWSAGTDFQMSEYSFLQYFRRRIIDIDCNINRQFECAFTDIPLHGVSDVNTILCPLSPHRWRAYCRITLASIVVCTPVIHSHTHTPKNTTHDYRV